MDFQYQKDPKKNVVDLKYSLPDNPPPLPPMRVYILRCDLFNGFELPESIKNGCIHLTCGPYKLKSPVVSVKNWW
jgi:phosphatidate phosphatase PAH1